MIHKHSATGLPCKISVPQGPVPLFLVGRVMIHLNYCIRLLGSVFPGVLITSITQVIVLKLPKNLYKAIKWEYQLI